MELVISLDIDEGAEFADAQLDDLLVNFASTRQYRLQRLAQGQYNLQVEGCDSLQACTELKELFYGRGVSVTINSIK